MLSACSEKSSSAFSSFSTVFCSCSMHCLPTPLTFSDKSSMSISALATRCALKEAFSSKRVFSRLRLAILLFFCSALATSISCFSVSLSRRTLSRSRRPAASMRPLASSWISSSARGSAASSAMPQVTSCSFSRSFSSEAFISLIRCAALAARTPVTWRFCASRLRRWRLASFRFAKSASSAFRFASSSLAACSRKAVRSTSPSSAMASSGPQSTAMHSAGLSAQKRSCSPTRRGSKTRGSRTRPFSMVPCELPKSKA
mmetsp:Transcript_63832/g.137314  ORF Transcript_63832/g.137314 Transcript_63832/m.137314 type:complete len:258 (-) Transcript_63832:207-980(-)